MTRQGHGALVLSSDAAPNDLERLTRGDERAMTLATTTARGAVLRAFDEPLVVETAPIPTPESGAVIARVGLAGICGTDLHLSHGRLPIPTPLILGHEAVGTVAALGAGVERDFTGQPLAV